MHGEGAIRVRGLVKRFETVVAVDGLDLDVRVGECFALLGPNGAGKTTTVEILEGLQTPTSGNVRVLGQAWTRGGQALKQRLGVQLQESFFPGRLTVREVTRLFRSFYHSGLDPETTLARVRLTEKGNDQVQKLSGGQKQRLSLACALVGDPELLFLDEPTTGLDPQSRLEIWDIVSDLKRRGRTIMLTTHYMEEAQRLCERVAIIDRGRLIALGTPKQLIASLDADQIVEIEAEPLPEPQDVRSLAGVHGASVEDGRLRLTVDSLHGTLPRLLASLERDGASIDHIETHQASLEDVFVSLTGRHLDDE